MFKNFLMSCIVLNSFAFAFNEAALKEVESLTTGYPGQGPYKLEDSKFVFAIEGGMNALSKSRDPSFGNRYFYRQRAQRDSQYMVGFRFESSLGRKSINKQGVSPRSISFYKNQDKSMQFRTLEFSNDGKSLATYQECWQVDVKNPQIQCALVNKVMCEQINKENYDWDKSYRKAAQSYRAQMIARFEYETFPPDLNENKGMGLGVYEAMEDYTYENSDLLSEFPSAIRMRLDRACKNIPFADTLGPNEVLKY